MTAVQSSVNTADAASISTTPANGSNRTAPDTSGARGSDLATLSPTALLLNGLEYQLANSKPTDFRSLLEGAATNVDAAAHQEISQDQIHLLESIANRLRFAANLAGLSSRTSLSLGAVL